MNNETLIFFQIVILGILNTLIPVSFQLVEAPLKSFLIWCKTEDEFSV